MNAKPSPWTTVLRAVRHLACATFAVWLLTAALPSQAKVDVDQSPLVIQKPLPPNIVLMQDDSGSMGSDYMPDWQYITDNTSAMSLRYSGHNYTYYNPGVIYTPPPRADGTLYPNSPGLGNAFADGFRDRSSADEVDVTTHYGSYPYFVKLTTTSSSTYDPSLACTTGDTLMPATDPTHPNMCQHATVSSVTTYQLKGNSTTCNAGDQLVQNPKNLKYECQHTDYAYTYYTPTLTCPYGGTLNTADQKCVQAGSSGTDIYFFAYTTLDSSGNYVQNLVGKSVSDCAVAVSQGYNCDFSAQTQQSVANWFSYYRTRILMTKSGVMSAFVTLPSEYRIGFGSINNRNAGGLPANVVTYNNKKIAAVQSFGDGSPGTQKAAMWSWLEGLTAGGGTPLRNSLDAVGQYYSTAQPWQTSSSDSTELACRQSYTILTSDGFWNSTSSPGTPNIDGTAQPTVTGPNSQSYTYTPVAPYADSYSDTLADVAMKYWVTDLRPNVSNEVTTTPSVDDAFWQHMVTFTLGIGVSPVGIQPAGTSVDDIFAWANGGAAISNFSWPQPQNNTILNVADFAHAAVNGHGGFYSATTPQQLTVALQGALQRAGERVGTGASLAANSTQLKTGTVAYQANFYTVSWKGDLKALPIDSTTGQISTVPQWQAANQIPNWTVRNIYTYNPDGSTYSTQYVPFISTTLLSAAQDAALGSDATTQQAVLNYLRGDPSNERGYNGGTFRQRATPLGDIVDSQPVYVGTPNANQFYGENFTGSVDFQAFYAANVNRTALVWVAANDGMLHGFNATTGQEVYAYLPGAVITSGLSNLTNPFYGTIVAPHQYYNDGELTVADVYINGAWSTVLVGTTGRGLAKAVYALDITDPNNIKLLWERSAGDGKANSDYIGQMVGKPVIAQTSDGSWSALIGNGYNSTVGRAALLQFDIATGTLSVHLTADSSVDNGLAAPAVWIGNYGNGVSTTAYAGDLNGKVWSFALQSTSGNSSNPTPSSTGTLVFQATNSAGNQAITAGLLVGQDPNTSNLWLFFGTGRYLSQSDLLDTSVQSWYGIITQSSDTTLPGNLLSQGVNSLVQRYIIAQTTGDPTASPPLYPQRAVTPMPTPSDMTGKSGWFMNLLPPNGIQEGERMVTPNQFQANLLLGTTRIPEAKDFCNPSGSGWLMDVDPWTGTNPQENFFDANGDGQINSGDSITVNGKTYASAGIGFSSLPNNPIFVGNVGLVGLLNGKNAPVMTSGGTGKNGRVAWREFTTQ